MVQTMLIRPVLKNDLDSLEELALQAGPGMTNLPANPAILADKIKQSKHNFHPNSIDIDKGLYFFVLEDTANHKVVGCSAIAGRANNESPIYHFKVASEVLYCKQLNFTKEHQVLYMVNDYQHTTEVCSLFVDPEYRHSHNGTLISRARFLFMSEFPQRFAQKIIAELRGYIDEKCEAPFWHGFAKKFLPIDYSHTDQLTGSGQRQFIHDLLPQVPIFATLLSKEAQNSMGEIQVDTLPAYNVLRKEGFEFNNYIDVFDGGPTLEANRDRIVSVRKNRKAVISNITATVDSTAVQLISNTSLDFRACQGCIDIAGDGIVNLDKNIAELLRVKVGDSIRFIDIHL